MYNDSPNWNHWAPLVLADGGVPKNPRKFPHKEGGMGRYNYLYIPTCTCTPRKQLISFSGGSLRTNLTSNFRSNKTSTRLPSDRGFRRATALAWGCPFLFDVFFVFFFQIPPPKVETFFEPFSRDDGFFILSYTYTNIMLYYIILYDITWYYMILYDIILYYIIL